MRKRNLRNRSFKKMFDYSPGGNKYWRQYESKTIKNYFYGKNEYRHISRLLYGRCLIFEGLIPVGWKPENDDYTVRVNCILTRKQIKHLDKIANTYKKKLFIFFEWGDKGFIEIVFTVILEKLTERVISEILRFWEKESIKSIELSANKEISIVNDKDECYLYQSLEANDTEINRLKNELLRAKNIYDKNGKMTKIYENKENRVDFLG